MKLEKKQIDALNIELTLNVEQGDYAEIEHKKLAQRRKTADFKGFRKGMVPESLVRRVYGDQILAESVNEVISKGLQDFIDENKLNVLGEPLSSENQPEVEWKDGNDFKFVFDIATYPDFEVSAGKEDVVNKYSISATAKNDATGIENAVPSVTPTAASSASRPAHATQAFAAFAPTPPLGTRATIPSPGSK